MARRKRTTVTTKPELVSRPDGALEAVYEADPDGRPVVHHRTVDTLGIMLRAGTITQGMHDAARDFQRSIREWAMRQGWGGRPVRVEQAQGILVAALGVLAGWYGYAKS